MLTPAMTRKGVSALDWIRTNDTRFRRAVLYPLSYEGLGGRLPADRPAHDQPGIGVAPCSHCTRAELRDCCASPLGLAAPGRPGLAGASATPRREATSTAPAPGCPPSGRHWPASTAVRNGRPPIENCVSHPERTYPANHWHPPPVVCGTTQFPITKYVPDQGRRTGAIHNKT